MVKILVIEDTEFFQKLYSNELTKAGFEVEIACDGEEGLQKIKQLKPSLVFMDIVMPKLNGIDALARMKTDPEIKNTPVVMLTSIDSDIKGEDSLLKGAVAYLVKNSVTPQEIVLKAEEILGTSEARLDPLKTL